MGSAELDIHHRQLFVYSNIITYGNAANPEITEMIRDEIETMWNEPTVSLKFDNFWFEVRFKIHAWYNPIIDPLIFIGILIQRIIISALKSFLIIISRLLMV
jgi:hypothetical protein